jgi:hypothetical protein
MGFSRGAGSEEGACLIFAHTAKEARKLAHRVMLGWFDGEWIDTAVRRLRGKPWLMLEADMAKLAEDEPHAIECPTTCPTCGQWGHEQIAGRCSNCGEVSNVEVTGAVHSSAQAERK